MLKRVSTIFILAVAVISPCGNLLAGFADNPMDFNHDFKVDLLDFAEFASHWLWEAVPDPNEFALIPAGTFEMGDHFEEGSSDEFPVHAVTLDSFYISKYETTNQQYCDYLNAAVQADEIKIINGLVYAIDDTGNSYPYCGTNGVGASQIVYTPDVFSVNVKDGTTDMSTHPMVEVSWVGAIAYCNWRSRQDGLESCYDLAGWMTDFTKNGYRLATEAEWEYAARGGEDSPYYRYPWGDSIDASMANFFLSSDPYETGGGLWPHTTPVGYYNGSQTPSGADMANGYGLYDMAGNVSEWCNDFYDENYYQFCVNAQVTSNPTGPGLAQNCVLRGGDWDNSAQLCRIANRSMISPSGLNQAAGFRVCVFSPFGNSPSSTPAP